MSIWNDDCPATAPAQADGLEVVMEAIRLRPDGAWCHLYSDEARGSRRGDPAFQVEPLVLKSAADARMAELQAENERLRGLLEEARKPSWFWDENDPEQGETDPDSIIDRYAPGEIVRIKTATYGPDIWGVGGGGETYERRTFATADEAEAWFQSTLTKIGEPR